MEFFCTYIVEKYCLDPAEPPTQRVNGAESTTIVKAGSRTSDVIYQRKKSAVRRSDFFLELVELSSV